MLGRCKDNARSLLAVQKAHSRRQTREAQPADADGEQVEEEEENDDEAVLYTNDTTHITTSDGEHVDLAEIPLWTALRGKVYNLTAYLPFHPGGGSILLRLATGRDCTKLFDRYHSWVNADALLDSCLVGPLVAEGADGGTRAVRADRVG